MKSSLKYIAGIILLLGACFSSCKKENSYSPKDDNPIYEISLDRNRLELHENQQVKLTAKVTPNKPNPVFEWTTSDNLVAKVDNDGNVMAVSLGQARITVKLKGINSETSCIVNVVKENKHMETVARERRKNKPSQIFATVSICNITFMRLLHNGEYYITFGIRY